jgi:uncharacterized protein YgiM (DUF1202 family)
MRSPAILYITALLVFSTASYGEGFADFGKKLGEKIGGILGGGGTIEEKVEKAKEETVNLLSGEGMAGADALIGVSLGKYLSPNDKNAFAKVTLDSLVSGKSGNWNNTESGVRGTSEVVDSETVTEPVSINTSEDKVNEVPPLDLIGAPYAVKSNANVRKGPATGFPVVGSLRGGDVVTVIGSVQNEPWYLVGDDGIAQGFVYASLLAEADYDAQETATLSDGNSDTVVAQKVQAQKTCRTVKQTIIMDDGSEAEETVTACQGPNGWVMQG